MNTSEIAKRIADARAKRNSIKEDRINAAKEAAIVLEEKLIAKEEKAEKDRLQHAADKKSQKEKDLLEMDEAGLLRRLAGIKDWEDSESKHNQAADLVSIFLRHEGYSEIADVLEKDFGIYMYY